MLASAARAVRRGAVMAAGEGGGVAPVLRLTAAAAIHLRWLPLRERERVKGKE